MQYDVVIIGAGLVGLTLANALSSSSLHIAIVDRTLPPAEFNPEKDSRVSALTLSSQRLFENLAVWSLIPADRISSFHRMQVWDAIGSGHLDFDSREVAEETLGYVMENSVLQTALYKKLNHHSKIDFIRAEILEIIDSSESDTIQVKLTDNKILISKLLIGADGGDSKVRQLAGIDCKTWEYGQTALVCNVRTGLPHEQIARQCFLPHGPLAFLPLVDPYECSIVWSTNSTQADLLMQLSANEFKQKLAEAFAHRLGTIEHVSQRYAFPLQMRHAKHYVQAQIALVGDAAHTIHPLAGQGVNLGLQDVATLAKLILAAVANKKSIGSKITLRPYERSRKSENTIMITFIELIKHSFTNDSSLLRSFINFGFGITNKFAPLKKIFMRHAMGLNKVLYEQ